MNLFVTVLAWAVIILFTGGAFSMLWQVDKPRKPLDPLSAAFATVLVVGLVFLLLRLLYA